MASGYEMKCQLFSNQYYDFLERFVKTDFEDTKVLGKFYTDIGVAETLISDLLSSYKCDPVPKRIRVIDPFCGDGRLIRILLLQMSCESRFQGTTIETVLWDVDEKAVFSAKEAIEKMRGEISLQFEVQAQAADSFVLYSSEESSFDICITNPPWGLLKPQKLFNGRCNSIEIEEYKCSIARYDDYMKSEFTLSQPTKKFGRWGTNLGRVGTELALKLIKKDGICGIVSPASLFNDQVSIPLREWIFNNHKILYLSYYPAELKLYGTADVSSVTAVFGCGETTDSFVIRLFDAEKKCTLKQLTPSSFDYIKRNLYSLPLESGFESIEILQYLETLPSVLSFCNSNDFRFTRELDETRIAEKLLTSGNIVFAKGYMVDRYCFLGDGLFVDEEKVDVPDSSQKWKIVWRDVSRNSQCRRMKATLLPPGHIAGNSLGIIYAEDEANIDELKLLLAVMNSMVFEFQARCLLVSNHVAAGIIKQIRIPQSMFDSTIVGLVDRQLMGNDCSQELEIRVAKLYGLSIEQFMSIVVAFDLDSQIVQQIAEKVCLIYGEDY